MAYPYQVDPANVIRLTSASTKNLGPGVIVYGGAYYSVYFDRVDSTIEVWRSTDRGITWAEDNAAGHKLAAIGFGEYAWAEDTSGADKRIWVLWHERTTNRLAFAAFNLITRQWGSSTTGGPLSSDYGEPFLAMSIPDLGSPSVWAFVDGPREVVGANFNFRAYYFELPITTGIWPSPQRLNGAAGEDKCYLIQGATRAANGNMVAFTYSTGQGLSTSIQARTVTSGGALGNWFTFHSDPGTQLLTGFGIPFVNTNGTSLAFPYTLRSGSDTIFKLATATSALNPAWAQEAIRTEPTINVSTGNVAGVFLGTDPVIMWGYRDGAPGTIRRWYYTRRQSGVWGSAVQIYQIPNSLYLTGIVSMHPVTGGMGAVFEYGNTPPANPMAPWYWEQRTGGNLNSLLGAMRSPKIA